MRLLWFLALAPSVALAASIVDRPLRERAAGADRVALVQVLASRTLVPLGDLKKMRTVTRVQVGEDLKGKGPSQIEITQLGGRFGLWESHVAGDATFAPGETAVLLLRCAPRPVNGWAQCALLGLKGGKVPFVAGLAVVAGPLGPQPRTLDALKAELTGSTR